MPVHSLSISKPYVVPPRDDTRQLGTSRPQAKLQGTRRRICPKTCGMQAHRRVDMPWCP
ncbi:MAG: hypothetical protein ABW185_24885 [Sedimenticola sp.]